MKFDWDESKNISNIEKHKIDFDDAIHIWENHVIEKVDPRKYCNEIRFIAMGEIDGRLHVVVYTWRDEVRRIISARKANERERKAYHQALFGATQTKD